MALLLLGGSAAAEIYRCQQEGVVIFSDRPCQADAQPHRPVGMVSYIPAADDLEETARRNRAFLEQRRARLAEARERHRKADEANEAPSTPAAGYGPNDRVLHVPYLIDDRRRSPHGRRPAEAAQPPAAGDQRFSALGGRLPGTRRDSDDRSRRQ